MDGITEAIWTFVTSGRMLGAAAVLIITSCVVDLVNRPAYPKQVPRVGYGKGLLATIKTFFMAPSRLKSWVDDGYEKVRRVHNSKV